MKLITPRNLVILAMFMSVTAVATVFVPANQSPVSYEKIRDQAGKDYADALYDANFNGKGKEAEGRVYFDAGARAFDQGQTFKESYTGRYNECIKSTAYAYCEAAGKAFSEGYFYSDKYQRRNQAYILKQTQRDNWQTDVKNGKLPSYLIRQ